MTKRNPIAPSLAKPQYRQRVFDRTRYEMACTEIVLMEYVGYFMAFNCETTERDYSAKLEGWQEPLRQMEG